MHDINNELRTSYFSRISGNIIIDGNPIPYFYGQVPINTIPANPDNYILLNALFSTNYNDDSDSYLLLTIQFMIVTKALQNNAGSIKDAIASQLYSIVFPDVRAHSIQITSGQVFDTKMANDTEQGGLNDGEKKVMNRIISFRHRIKIDGSGGSNVGLIYYGVQDDTSDPVDFGNALSQDGNLPISVDYGAWAAPKVYWLAVPVQFDEKTDWQDLNDEGNAGKIGADTDLYEVRSMDIDGDAYVLYITRYKTGYNGLTSQVRYY